MNGGIMLLDNINITFIDGTEKIYNVIYYNDKGFFLRTEGESLITSLHIKDSKLITNYHSNIYVKSIKDIASVNIEEESVEKRNSLASLSEGHLLTYDTKMANKYFLDEEMASEELKFKEKRKIKRRAIKSCFSFEGLR